MAVVLPAGIGVTVCIVALSAFLFYYIARFLRIFLLISKFDGPPAVPIFGNTLQFKSDPREHFLYDVGVREKYRHQSGGVIRMWFGPLPIVLIYNAVHCEALMNSSRHINKGTEYTFMEPWLGKGLLTSGGQKWFHRRKLLTPTFHFSILQSFMEVFNEQSMILVKKLGKFADESETVNIFPLVTHCVLDIICDTAMGKRTNAQSDNENEYVKAVGRMSHLIVSRIRNFMLWPDWIYNRTDAGKDHEKALQILHGVTNKMIQERLHDPLHSPNGGTYEDDAVTRKRKRIAFLDLLLQMHREDATFTLEAIREEVDTFMFEGHDTTAAAVNWALLLIGQHPTVQARLHDEIDQVFGDSERPITSDDLSELSYLSCVVKESLRLLPSVPGIGRDLDEDIIVNGKVVPKGASVFLSIYGIHHDPEQFPDPERFDPDRFLPENSTKRHPFAFIPFSAGPRNCIGQKFAMMEDKVILINLLRRFSVKSLQTLDEAKPAGLLILRPAEGTILVKLSLRK
ncbi:cytochrome P450 4V2 isoform X2 [Strongylocentrotus purpuratus]|uniref:Cytochrome P450 n=1 Tax=Strongylocentrotus purpuratus TaxID=7668 RepID=A0A7M7PRC4_STRPU|nr:cytochrome P450 4V2 isoform X2 [Strongylocentrotus purpuratus]